MQETKKYLDKFGKFIVQQSKSNLSKKKKKDRGNLYDSLRYELEVHKNSFSLAFYMEDYGKFVDKGVKGISSSAKAPSSPYKFGTGTGIKGGLSKGIDGWVRRKGIQFRDSSGKFISYDSTSYLIRNSIWNKGLETTNFFERPFELAFKKIPDEITEAYGLELESLMKFSLQ